MLFCNRLGNDLPIPLLRKEMLLLTTEEVVEQVEEALGRTGEPVQVILPDPTL